MCWLRVKAIDRNQTMLFAESDPIADLTITASATQTLKAIAYDYFGNVSQVATDNQQLKLRSGQQLVVSEGTYIVGPDASGGNLSNIATHFGTTPEAIRQANPQISWPDSSDELAQYTALYLPVLTIEVGTSPGSDTLNHLAQYYGINLSALANQNQDVAGIFEDDQAVKISGGPVITASTIPAGNVTVEAIRPQPSPIPDTLTNDNYGEIFLRNLYSLLSYQISDNPEFKGSGLGLPASPTAKPENSQNLSKIRIPKQTSKGDDWVFRLSLPYSPLSRQSLKAESELPRPQQQSLQRPWRSAPARFCLARPLREPSDYPA